MDKQEEKENLWEKQGKMLRNPMEVYGASAEQAGWMEKSLEYKTTGSFTELLEKLNLTLIFSREYEHLVLSLNAKNGVLNQGFVSLPHPSGIAISEDQKRVFIASTRNPNSIVEFGVTDAYMKRLEDDENINPQGVLMPLRTKYFPGAYYFHDICFINKELYANSVGQNGVVKVKMDSSETDRLFWQIEIPSSSPEELSQANYIQLNSIAAGETFDKSFFSASIEKPNTYLPGHENFPINKTGVIFNHKSEVVGRGLTRPHSARLHKGEIWVNNSGYGEVGKIVNGQFEAQYKLPGWTRGLKFINEYLIVGYSVVLKKYTQYAPGIDYEKAKCGIAIINTNTNQIEGNIEFPYGNQIFQLETINSDICSGFVHTTVDTNKAEDVSQHYKYIINR